MRLDQRRHRARIFYLVVVLVVVVRRGIHPVSAAEFIERLVRAVIEYPEHDAAAAAAAKRALVERIERELEQIVSLLELSSELFQHHGHHQLLLRGLLMRGQPVDEKFVPTCFRRAALDAQPLVHVHVHRREVDPGDGVVPDEVHALELRPRSRVRVQIQRRRRPEEGLAADREQVIRIQRLDVRGHLFDPRLQRVAGVARDVVLQTLIRRASNLHGQIFRRPRLVHEVPPEYRRVVAVSNAGEGVHAPDHRGDVVLVQPARVRVREEIVPARQLAVAATFAREKAPSVVRVRAAVVLPVVREGDEESNPAFSRLRHGVV